MKVLALWEDRDGVIKSHSSTERTAQEYFCSPFRRLQDHPWDCSFDLQLLAPGLLLYSSLILVQSIGFYLVIFRKAVPVKGSVLDVSRHLAAFAEDGGV